MMHTLLIADDEKNTREGLKWALERKNLNIMLAADGGEALRIVRNNTVDVLITDLKMPVLDGMSLLERVRNESPATTVVVLTGHGTVESAVDAMKHGAYDYLIKPINIDELNLLVERILNNRSMAEENEQLRQNLHDKYGFENIIGKSDAMMAIFSKVRTVAASRANVLLYGESGTGKEIIANAIHQNSPRRANPFVKVNCGALPLTLLESELFGHEKGAFTNAIRQKPGRFEMADGGTLLLDEISETAPEFQVKLLRVLQEGEFERVGGTQTLKTDVRVIAATNKRLDELVREGRFREDLYYRLKVVEIALPPLRDRREDIPLLVDHFLDEFSKYYTKPKPRVAARAMTALQNFPWPGNVRQLKNVIESTMVMNEGELTMKSLPDEIRQEGGEQNVVRIPASASLREAERELIQAALITNSGNRAKTARQLGLGRKTLYRKLEDYGIE
ncbi:MAG: sigma-54 dependent transcriptional regulator [bacterium]|nr:sigma-54 dependent transcriptional regulator [Candidatus Sumerlaeota bacterium]